MESIENIKNYALLGAVEAGNVNSTRQLLNQGANPNYTPKWVEESLMHLALRKKHIKIVELLVRFKGRVKDSFVKEIFSSQHSEYFQDLLDIIVDKNKKDIKLIQSIFVNLMKSQRPSEKLLKFVLDLGLPVNDHIGSKDIEEYTPLHICINAKNLYFVR